MPGILRTKDLMINETYIMRIIIYISAMLHPIVESQIIDPRAIRQGTM